MRDFNFRVPTCERKENHVRSSPNGKRRDAEGPVASSEIDVDDNLFLDLA